MILLPMFPILGWLLGGTGTGMVLWYQSMSSSQRDAANRIASDLAGSLYDTTVQYLTTDQAARVWTEVRRRLVGF